MTVKKVSLKDGSVVPAIGQGTWKLGEDPDWEKTEIAALREGIEHGLTLIDTAEMYGEGLSETLVGKAIRQYDRDSLFLVSKVLPYNAGRNHIFDSCEASLRRLNTDYLDLYLLHWPGNVPLSETVDCMEELVSRGLIRRWGVSNFDCEDMKHLSTYDTEGHCATDQVLYHVASRGVEYDLLPMMRGIKMPMMAYCPLAQAGRLREGLFDNHVLRRIAEEHNATVAQILLAFVTRDNDIIAIPRSGNPKHAVENASAADIHLSVRDIELIDREFPAPACHEPLDIV